MTTGDSPTPLKDAILTNARATAKAIEDGANVKAALAAEEARLKKLGGKG